MNSPKQCNVMAIIKPLTLYNAIKLNIIAPHCIHIVDEERHRTHTDLRGGRAIKQYNFQ